MLLTPTCDTPELNTPTWLTLLLTGNSIKPVELMLLDDELALDSDSSLILDSELLVLDSDELDAELEELLLWLDAELSEDGLLDD